jgi:hypothetical protein
MEVSFGRGGFGPVGGCGSDVRRRRASLDQLFAFVGRAKRGLGPRRSRGFERRSETQSCGRSSSSIRRGRVGWFPWGGRVHRLQVVLMSTRSRRTQRRGGRVTKTLHGVPPRRLSAGRGGVGHGSPGFGRGRCLGRWPPDLYRGSLERLGSTELVDGRSTDPSRGLLGVPLRVVDGAVPPHGPEHAGQLAREAYHGDALVSGLCDMVDPALERIVLSAAERSSTRLG